MRTVSHNILAHLDKNKIIKKKTPAPNEFHRNYFSLIALPFANWFLVIPIRSEFGFIH